METLINAAKKGDMKLIEDAIAYKVELDKQDINGVTALIYASYEGHYEVVVTLLKAGAKINSTDVNNGTGSLTFALSSSSSFFSLSIIYIILQFCSNPFIHLI